MTIADVSEVLSRWPGRFRSATLLQLLATRPDAGSHEVAHAVLRGVLVGQDEGGAVRSLVDDGWYATAEDALETCPLLAKEQMDELHEHLAVARNRTLYQVREGMAATRRRAELAELSLELDERRLEQESQRDHAEAMSMLRREAELLNGRLVVAADELRTFLPSGEAGMLRAQCEALILDGNLRAARRLLEGHDVGRRWPVAVPRLPWWDWRESAGEVLMWYGTPRPPVQPRFHSWRATRPDALALMEAARGLMDRRRSAPAALMQALDTFLRADDASAPAGTTQASEHGSPEVQQSEVGEGWLGEIGALVDAARRLPILARPVRDVYVAGPEEESVPDQLTHQLSGPFLAVGSRLSRPNPPRRSAGAVLTLEDLLLLARETHDRELQLLRLAAAQWPLSVLHAGNAADLRRHFEEAGAGNDDRVEALAWIVDLAGFREPWLADAIAHQTALVPELVEVFLTRLTTGDNVPLLSPDGVSTWADDGVTVAAVEQAVLAPFPAIGDQLAFWALLLVDGSAPGVDVADDDVLLMAELICPDALPLVEAALPGLERSPLVRRVSEGRLRLPSCGVVTYLSGIAERQLEDLGSRAVGLSVPAAKASLERLHWDLLRYAPYPGYPHALEVLSTRTEVEAAVAVEDLAATARGVPPEDLDVDGECDLQGVLEQVAEHFRTGYPGDVEIVVLPGEPCRAGVRAETMLGLLHDLLAGTVENLPGRGTISVAVNPDADYVEIDVRDTGTCLDVPPDRPYQFWRPGRSGSAPEGMLRARRLAQHCEGDLHVVSPRTNHPRYPGAHIRLVLPRDTEPFPG